MLTTQEKFKKIMESPVLWIETFCSIVNKAGKVVPFKLNPEQKYLLSNISRHMVCLKGRQIGISSAALVYMLFLTQNKPNITCALMSYKIESAKILLNKLKMIYRDLPQGIKVPLKTNTKESISFTNGSQILTSTMGNIDAFRGATCSFVLISEAAFSKNLLDQLWAVNCSLVSSGSILVESTPKGINEYYDLYSKAERRENSYHAFFFPWYRDTTMHNDNYKMSCKRWLSTHDNLLTFEELDDEEAYLFEKGATMEQLVWRRYEVADGGLDKFHSEYPSNSTEAFIHSSGNNVFDTKDILERLQYINENKALTTYPSDLPTNLRSWFNRGLYIWKTPQHNMRYHAGVDTAEGLGGDRDSSVIEIIDDEGFQCCEFRSNKVKPHVFSAIVNDLGLYYNKALLVIEKASAGHIVVEKLHETYHYSRLFKYKSYDMRGKVKRKIGWETNAKSKPIMINMMVEMFETGQLCINSEYLLKEMKMFMHSDDGKMSATRSEHDDSVIAMALSCQALKNGKRYI